jgi:plastocyanin
LKRRFEWPGAAIRCVLVTALVAAVVSAGQLAVSPRIAPARADTAIGSAGLFVPAQGTVLDTRSGVGGVSGPVAAATWYPVQVAGLAGVPASGVSSVQVSVTAFNPTLSGYLQLAADGVADTQTSALIYTGGGGSFSASSIVALSPDGEIKVLAQRSVSLLIAVQGYYTAGDGAPAPGGYVPITPTRLVDTRVGTGLPQAKLAVGSTTAITVGGLANVPADASAVFVMLTGISSSTAGGTFTPYPTGATKPADVALSYLPNTATILGAAVDLGSGGRFNLAVGSTGTAIDLVVDVVGYYSASSGTGGAFTPAAARVYDSRISPSVEIPGSATRKLAVGGIAGVPLPSTGISAYALSLQVLHPGPNPGFVAVGLGDQTAAAFVSSVYLTPGDELRSNLVIAQAGADGTIQVFNHSPDPIDIVIDVEGWYADPGPGLPVVESSAYPEQSWTPSGGGLATFSVADSGTGSTVTSFSYRLDDATSTTVAGSGSTFSFTPPSVPGPHTLSVVASDRLGIASPTNDYTFNIGSPPAAPAEVAVTAGAASADLSWVPGRDNGAPALGYAFWVIDRTSSSGTPLGLGTCSRCTHFVLSGLDPAHTYAAQVAAVSAAGQGAVSTSADFIGGVGDVITCSASDDACVGQDVNQAANTDPVFTNYDLSGTDAQTATASAAGLSAEPAGTSATSDPQCSIAQADRVGTWACDDSDDSSGSTAGQPSPAWYGGGYCILQSGCWIRTDDFKASWSATVVYGYGSTRLGTAKGSITWQLVGARSISKPIRWSASGQTRNVMFSAAMYNGAPGVPHGGSYIRDSQAFSPSTAVAGPGTTISWNPNGYSFYNNTMYDHNVVTQFSWNVPGYPGYWYFYARSLCSHTKTRGNAAIYRFAQLSTGMPGDKSSAGYRN